MDSQIILLLEDSLECNKTNKEGTAQQLEPGE